VKPFSEISPRRLAWILAALAGIVCAAIAAAQVILPRVAEGRIRAHLGDQAAGLNVDVRATPAIKLLTGRVDRVTIEADRLRAGAGNGGSAPPLDEMLSRADNIAKLDVRVERLEAPQGIEARNVVLHKDGDAISASGGLDLRALRNVLPPGLSVKPLPAPDGQILLEGSASPFGASIGARARVLTEGGRVVVRAEGLPFASLVSIPVFESDRLSVDGLSAKPTGNGLVVKVRGHLNG
jgi:hypothetical protein